MSSEANTDGAAQLTEEQFRLLEEKVAAVLALIARLKEENQELRERLESLRHRRQEAVARLNIILDKLASLR